MPASRTRVELRRRATIVAAATLWLASLAATASGEGHGAPAAQPGAAEGGHAAGAQEDPLDLGEIDIREFHPTHHDPPHIRLAIHLQVAEDAEPERVAELAHWKRRLRDQAIIAVRGIEPAALAEPGLDRLRRVILLRLRRLPLPTRVEQVRITEFSVTVAH